MFPTARSALFRISLFRSRSPLLSFHNVNAATLRRAYASEAKSAAENAFIKEREAVQHHAAQTAGKGVDITIASPPLHGQARAWG